MTRFFTTQILSASAILRRSAAATELAHEPAPSRTCRALLHTRDGVQAISDYLSDLAQGEVRLGRRTFVTAAVAEGRERNAFDLGVEVGRSRSGGRRGPVSRPAGVRHLHEV